MAYKDKDRQREANRAAQQRRRQGMTEGMTEQGMTEPVSNTLRPANYGTDDCTCRHCQNNRAQGNRLTINHGAYKDASQLKSDEVNRQSLPGDDDYEGVSRHEGRGGLEEGFAPNGAGAE